MRVLFPSGGETDRTNDTPCRNVDLVDEEVGESFVVSPVGSTAAEEEESARGHAGEETGKKPEWFGSKAGRDRVMRVMDEMEWHEASRGKAAAEVHWESADDAESEEGSALCVPHRPSTLV